MYSVNSGVADAMCCARAKFGEVIEFCGKGRRSVRKGGRERERERESGKKRLAGRKTGSVFLNVVPAQKYFTFYVSDLYVGYAPHPPPTHTYLQTSFSSSSFSFSSFSEMWTYIKLQHPEIK